MLGKLVQLSVRDMRKQYRPNEHDVFFATTARYPVTADTMQVVPKLKKPPPHAVGPPWMLKSLSMMRMMPYMMSAYPFHSQEGFRIATNALHSRRHRHNPAHNPVGGHMAAAHRAMRFNSQSSGGGMDLGTSDVWIRGIHDALGTAVGV